MMKTDSPFRVAYKKWFSSPGSSLLDSGSARSTATTTNNSRKRSLPRTLSSTTATREHQNHGSNKVGGVESLRTPKRQRLAYDTPSYQSGASSSRGESWEEASTEEIVIEEGATIGGWGSAANAMTSSNAHNDRVVKKELSVLTKFDE